MNHYKWVNDLETLSSVLFQSGSVKIRTSGIWFEAQRWILNLIEFGENSGLRRLCSHFLQRNDRLTPIVKRLGYKSFTLSGWNSGWSNLCSSDATSSKFIPSSKKRFIHFFSRMSIFSSKSLRKKNRKIFEKFEPFTRKNVRLTLKSGFSLY